MRMSSTAAGAASVAWIVRGSFGSVSKRIVFPIARERARTMSRRSTSSASTVTVPVALSCRAKTRETYVMAPSRQERSLYVERKTASAVSKSMLVK